MPFKTRQELKNFIRGRLYPRPVNFTDQYRMTLFEFHGSIKNFAMMLRPEINLQLRPSDKKLKLDPNDVGLFWKRGNHSIEAVPIGDNAYMVVIASDIEGSNQNLADNTF